MKYLFPLFFLGSISCFSQSTDSFTYKLTPGQVPLSKVINFTDLQKTPDWDPNIITGESSDEFSEDGIDKTPLIKMKEEYLKKKQNFKIAPQSNEAKSNAAQPVLGTNFSGFFANSVPNDNHIAISNGGKIVSVFNSTLRVFNSVGTTLYTRSLSSFASSLGSFSANSDPRVLYDPQTDRFIVVFFSGFSSATSKIIVAFSQTNDPAGNWNFYQLSGNYQNDTTWSDYPIVTLSNNDLFITFNQLEDGKTDWRQAFKYSIIWQIDKSSGYSGTGILFNYWSDIKYNNKPIWNICPVQGGSSPTGPETYFVSVRSYNFSNDTVFLHTVSDSKISGNAIFSSKVLKTDIPYGLPPNARQKNGQWLSTNDARVLSAIIENNKIQYVHNTIDPINFNSSIYLGSIDNPSTTTPIATAQIISSDTMNFGYPAIAYMGNGSSDNSVMITSSYLPDNGYPGTVLFYKDKNGSLANMLKIKDGQNYMTYVKTNFSDTLERWGDYNGIQRVYGNPNNAWLSGSWPKTAGGTYGTWIAKVSKTDTLLSVITEQKSSINDIAIYPNPTAERVNVEFKLKESIMLDFGIYDMQGKLVKILLQDKIKEGISHFTFSTSPLTDGVYFLKISSLNGILLNKKIVVQ